MLKDGPPTIQFGFGSELHDFFKSVMKLRNRLIGGHVIQRRKVLALNGSIYHVPDPLISLGPSSYTCTPPFRNPKIVNRLSVSANPPRDISLIPTPHSIFVALKLFRRYDEPESFCSSRLEVHIPVSCACRDRSRSGIRDKKKS